MNPPKTHSRSQFKRRNVSEIVATYTYKKQTIEVQYTHPHLSSSNIPRRDRHYPCLNQTEVRLYHFRRLQQRIVSTSLLASSRAVDIVTQEIELLVSDKLIKILFFVVTAGRCDIDCRRSNSINSTTDYYKKTQQQQITRKKKEKRKTSRGEEIRSAKKKKKKKKKKEERITKKKTLLFVVAFHYAYSLIIIILLWYGYEQVRKIEDPDNVCSIIIILSSSVRDY